MLDVSICVVPNGAPICTPVNTTPIVASCAASALMGRSRTTLKPILRAMRQPPVAIPSDRLTALATMLHRGTVKCAV